MRNYQFDDVSEKNYILSANFDGNMNISQTKHIIGPMQSPSTSGLPFRRSSFEKDRCSSANSQPSVPCPAVSIVQSPAVITLSIYDDF